MTLYTLITAAVMATTGQFQAASVMEGLTFQQCEQLMDQRRQALRQTANGQRWYLACVPMPAAPAQL